MIGRLPFTFPRLAIWPGLLLLAGLAAIFGARPLVRVLPAVSFIDSGQELGGDVEGSAVALGDLDGDGDPDAIVASPDLADVINAELALATTWMISLA